VIERQVETVLADPLVAADSRFSETRKKLGIPARPLYLGTNGIVR
jgi:2-polyprenyl-6-methoxyphenol hydroxylase-like FAD-dependent oxidoreductase